MRSLVSVTLTSLLLLSLAVAPIANAAGAVTPTIISAKGNDGDQTGKGLFDGTRVNEWSGDHVFYWGDQGNYVEVSFPKDVRLSRSGTSDWRGHIGDLIIKKKNADSSYTDVTATYLIHLTKTINETQWDQFTNTLPAGTYRFERNGTARLDSEWLVEDMGGGAKPTDSLISLLQGSNTLNTRISVVNYDQARSIKQSLILPYGYEKGV
jgi:hypothetical protein